MTREYAVKILRSEITDPYTGEYPTDDEIEAMKMGIESLENQKSIIEELKKIKEEIKRYVDENKNSEDLYLSGCGDGAYHSLAIINKHITELKGE